MLVFIAGSLLATQLSAPPMGPDVEALLKSAAGRPITTYIPFTRTTPPTMMYAAGDPLVVFLNRYGGGYSCGDDDAARNVSSIACNASGGVAAVGAFSGSDDQWTSVMSCMTELFAPFRLHITDVEPLDTAYVEAVVGGSPGDAGMPFGVGGVAPFGCELIPGAVVYAFADSYGSDTRAICETTAQEVAHAFGLDHEYLCEDPLTYLDGCGEKSFQDLWAACGEFEPRQCSCGDSSQNSVQAMLELFGAADGTAWVPPEDHALPTVELLLPYDSEILPADSVIEVMVEASDDVGLTAVQLEWGLLGERLFCPIEAPGYSCTRSGDTYIWQIGVSQGARTFRAHVRDVVGNEVSTEERTIWLSNDGSGPPADVAPPRIFLGSPLADSVVPTGTPFSVVATIIDDNAIALAELNWTRRGADNWIPCPYEDERVSCVVDGSTYRWTVSGRRAGPREFALRATDLLGKQAETGLVSITFEDGAAPPDAEGSVLEEALPLSCGDRVELDGERAAWFAVEAEVGDEVAISVRGPEGAGALVATDGNQLLSEGSDKVEVAMAEGQEVRVGVLPLAAGQGSFAVDVVCTHPAPQQQPGPFGCASSGCASSGPPGALLLLLLALRRRRF